MGGVMAHVVTIFHLVKQLEMKERRSIALAEIADATNLNRHTIKNLMDDQARSIRVDTLDKILPFFWEHGINATASDIIRYEPTNS